MSDTNKPGNTPRSVADKDSETRNDDASTAYRDWALRKPITLRMLIVLIVSTVASSLSASYRQCI